MKFILFLLLHVSFYLDVYCTDGLLSKFHQHGFKLKDVRFQLMSYDKDYFNSFEIKAFKFNRTTTAHNGSFNLKIAMEDKVQVLIQCYKFLSNEYRHFPVRFQESLKEIFDTNAIGIRDMSNCGNLQRIYFNKNVTYYVCNFVVDETRFPPLIPTGKYLAEVTVLYLNQKIAIINFYNEVYIPTVYPKK